MSEKKVEKVAVKKYTSLTYRQKKEIIDAVESGEKRRDVAIKFGIPKSTLATFLKQKDKICSSTLDVRKRDRKCEYPLLEEKLIEWLRYGRDQNIPLERNLLETKAKYYAGEMGIKNFSASAGWLYGFKKRHNLVFHNLCGESDASVDNSKLCDESDARVDNSACSTWKTNLRSLLQGYEPRNIFNADETGLFYKCLADRSICFQNESFHSGKYSKARITILLAANMDGSEKLKPLMIGKSAQPRCFKNIQLFPMLYKSNKKAWMTSVLLSEWVSSINETMKKEKREILLFIDYCTAHDSISSLSNVDVVFLPTTTKLQPLNQGIIQNFKSQYYQEIVMRTLDALDDGETPIITVHTAMTIADRAWKNVEITTIRNCFKTCGFITEEYYDSVSHDDDEQPEDIDVSDRWSLLANCEEVTTFNEYVHYDDDLGVMGTLTDAEILAANEHNEEKEDIKEDHSVLVSTNEAKLALQNLRHYFERTGDVPDEVFAALISIENWFDRIY